MNKYRVIMVHFLEPKPTPLKFTWWSNHITLVPWFLTTDLEKISTDIRQVCANKNPIPYKIGPDDYFGVGKDIKVSLITASKVLLDLHLALLDVALRHDKNMDVGFCGKDYVPHITHNSQPFPQENNKGLINSIYLVRDLSIATKEKKVIDIINLAKL